MSVSALLAYKVVQDQAPWTQVPAIIAHALSTLLGSPLTQPKACKQHPLAELGGIYNGGLRMADIGPSTSTDFLGFFTHLKDFLETL